MGESRRASPRVEARQETAALVATLGRVVRTERRRRRMTQAALAERVGWSRARISELERGEGLRAPFDVWVAVGLALGRPLAVAFSTSGDESLPADAGHLDLQEALIRLAHRHGWTGTFELPTRPANPSHSVDVCLRDDVARRLIVCECWNRFGDLGAAARSTSRKIADADGLAAALLDRGPYTVHACWLVRPTAANRALVRRYPGLLASRFTGSSRAWARTLNEGLPPPLDPGLVWFDGTGGATPVRRPRSGEQGPLVPRRLSPRPRARARPPAGGGALRAGSSP